MSRSDELNCWSFERHEALAIQHDVEIYESELCIQCCIDFFEKSHRPCGIYSQFRAAAESMVTMSEISASPPIEENSRCNCRLCKSVRWRDVPRIICHLSVHQATLSYLFCDMLSLPSLKIPIYIECLTIPPAATEPHHYTKYTRPKHR